MNCPRCGSYILKENYGTTEIQTCYYCGWKYSVNVANGVTEEIFSLGVMKIIFKNRGQVFICKDEDEKATYTRWIKEGLFEQDVQRALFTYSKDNSLHEERII